MRPHHGGIDHHALQVRVVRDLLEEPCPDAQLVPPGEALVDAVPRAILGGEQAPLRAATGHPAASSQEPLLPRAVLRVNLCLLLQQPVHARDLRLAQEALQHPSPATTSPCPRGESSNSRQQNLVNWP